MTERARPASAGSRTRLKALVAAMVLGAGLAGCLFDKPGEEVELTISKAPKGTERIRIYAVDPNDTGKVLAKVFDGDYSAGRVLKFSVGDAAGKDWTLKVEGYQDGYLVYLSLVPSGKGNLTEPLLLPVDRGLPRVEIAAVKRVGDRVHFTFAQHHAPAGLHQHINYGSDYIVAIPDTISVPAGEFQPGTLLTFDLHVLPSHDAFPVQAPDTMLADEALAPKGAQVQITNAFAKGDSVHVFVSTTNFSVPSKDEPIPGEGFPQIVDAKTFRILEFKARRGESNHLVAPGWALHDVDTIAAVLHYANLMRVRPLAADSIPAAQALRPEEGLPKFSDITYTPAGEDLMLSYQLDRADGYHVHVYKDKLVWPNPAGEYVTCHEVPCKIGPSIWKGATRLILSVQQDGTHNLLRPIVTDTLKL